MSLGGPPEPTGRPGGPGLWKHKGLELPAPIQRVAVAIMREKGLPRSEAIAIAVGAVKHFAVGKQYSAKTRAAGAAGVADWEAKRALAHGSHILAPRTERVTGQASARRNAQQVGVMRGH